MGVKGTGKMVLGDYMEWYICEHYKCCLLSRLCLLQCCSPTISSSFVLRQEKEMQCTENPMLMSGMCTSALWPLTPKIDTATWAFLGLNDMRHGHKKGSDMRHDYFLKLTG